MLRQTAFGRKSGLGKAFGCQIQRVLRLMFNSALKYL